MKRRNGRDALLMIAPVALLGVLGWMLRARKSAVFTVQKPVPFRPFIKRVRVLPARPVDVYDGYDTRVVVEFDAKGAKPAWWIKGLSSYYSRDAGQLVRVKGGQIKSLGRGGHFDSPHLDFESKKWISEYRLRLREVALHVGEVRLRDRIRLSNLSGGGPQSLWLDAPLRAQGVATKMPVVSRVPGVKVEALRVEDVPPTESHDGVPMWRVRWTLIENIPLGQSLQSGVGPQVSIVNRKGEDVGMVKRSSSSSMDYEGFLNLVGQPPADSRRHFATQDVGLYDVSYPYYPPVPAREPLWLKGSIRSGDAWPVSIRVPLRDANGKMLFAPRTPTAPFRVVSITKVAPDGDEVKEFADCAVRVVVQAWNPKADISKWRWEADFSQHLRDAQGKLLWEPPFKGGKRTIGASYSWSGSGNPLVIRYPLVLKSVPAQSGKLVFEAQIAANRSVRVPVKVVVRP